MSEHHTSPGAHEAPDLGAVENTVAPSGDTIKVEQAAAESESANRGAGLMSGPFGRNLGLVVALLIICVVGVATTGDRFASIDNVLTILRFASIVGVVSIGMTFVIIGGGIDLSVGAILALASVWATTFATQTMATDTHWLVMVFVAMAVGGACGLINGVLIAYGKIVPFIMTLAMLASARGLAEIISERRTQIVTVEGFRDVFTADILGVPILVVIFAVVSVGGWVLLNRTTFGRRTLAVGGSPEAARLAGINVNRHTMMLYVLVGLCCGLAALMFIGRTSTGSSTHGTLIELDAIAAVVIGGTLLTGGRGTIVGTVFGVLIFSTLSNVFVLNNQDSSTQAVAKGIIIVVAVLLQQRLARRTTST
ncbi:ABC transporter permease [Nocardioides sp. zg-1308]|uniref:ABC transporter permease n=1 Tax=Nocardioides renjunii TaxID=3095075 RepID=A0ABU5KE77_9ACTN|nr:MULTISPECIES: ABC transporter permease [unclassified Nocardioides]MDZ5662755.1 ABC transporter permease [Nocardioides sp. S-58]NPD05575.1 ABC transporter permease [Nocardioides sp. zg-1308]WQQ23462.1 ABC transporter permease [Nocardioides sp. S-34]